MKQTLTSGLLAVAIGVAVAVAFLLATHTLVEGQDGVVTATITINPLSVSLTVPSGPVAVGETFTVQAIVENQGESRIRRPTADLQLPSAIEVRGPAIHHLGSLPAFGTRDTEWVLTAAETGSFVLMVTAEGIDTSSNVTVSAESGAKVVTVE